MRYMIIVEGQPNPKPARCLRRKAGRRCHPTTRNLRQEAGVLARRSGLRRAPWAGRSSTAAGKRTVIDGSIHGGQGDDSRATPSSR